MAAANKELSSADICLVIECASIHNVSTLKYRDLQIEFHRTEASEKEAAEGRQIPEAPVFDARELQKIEADEFVRAEVTLREDQLALLNVTNPEAYEEAMSSGDLVNAEGGQQDDIGLEHDI